MVDPLHLHPCGPKTTGLSPRPAAPSSCSGNPAASPSPLGLSPAHSRTCRCRTGRRTRRVKGWRGAGAWMDAWVPRCSRQVWCRLRNLLILLGCAEHSGSIFALALARFSHDCPNSSNRRPPFGRGEFAGAGPCVPRRVTALLPVSVSPSEMGLMRVTCFGQLP